MGRHLQGIGASNGLATGRVLWWRKLIPHVQPNDTQVDFVETEILRLEHASSVAREQIEALRIATAERIGELEASVFDAHLAFLEDPSYMGEIQTRIREQHKSAEFACHAVTHEMSELLRTLPDEYLSARSDDIRDVGNRLLNLLNGQETFDPVLVEPGTVVVAEELTPSETAQLTDNVAGLITQRGSKTGHAAIIAKTLGIPLVVGLRDSLSDLCDNEIVIVNGDTGLVTIQPNEEELECVKKAAEIAEKRRQRALLTVSEPAVTSDNRRIHVFANIGSSSDVQRAIAGGAEGVGLFRTEFLYQESDHWPTEDEQFEAYKQVLEAFEGKPVIIRTLDIGGDKELPFATLPKEDNPFLGERAIRFCLAHTDIFRAQLRALLRASAFGNLWILLPMVENVVEIEVTKRLLEECREELEMEGVPAESKIPVGIMIEVPAAALMADVLAAYVDFMSIGTNDLTQYTLAVDRGNERIAHLYDSAHPAVLRLIRQTSQAAKKAGIPVSVCGELAADLQMVETLIGLGIKELSMSAPRIAEIKARIREVEATKSVDLAHRVLEQESAEKVRQFIEEMTATE